jgi:hypothetical protein
MSPEMNSNKSRKFFSPKASHASHLDLQAINSHQFLPGTGNPGTFLTVGTPASPGSHRRNHSTLDAPTGAFGQRKMTEKQQLPALDFLSRQTDNQQTSGTKGSRYDRSKNNSVAKTKKTNADVLLTSPPPSSLKINPIDKSYAGSAQKSPKAGSRLQINTNL